MYVLDIIFSNTDGKNFKLNKDSDLHAADIKYLSQSILAIPLVDKDSIKFDASLKYPSGRIDKPGVWSIKYLRRQSAYINSWNNWSFELAREYALGGWGNEEGGTYSPGKHTYTLQYNGNKVFSKSVKLK